MGVVDSCRRRAVSHRRHVIDCSKDFFGISQEHMGGMASVFVLMVHGDHCHGHDQYIHVSDRVNPITFENE
ncbi:hypothetical protein SLE2022_013590 [Rubroshorea leprosula]